MGRAIASSLHTRTYTPFRYVLAAPLSYAHSLLAHCLLYLAPKPPILGAFAFTGPNTTRTRRTSRSSTRGALCVPPSHPARLSAPAHREAVTFVAHYLAALGQLLVSQPACTHNATTSSIRLRNGLPSHFLCPARRRYHAQAVAHGGQACCRPCCGPCRGVP